MKYMLLIYLEEQAWQGLSETERQRIYGEYRKFSQEIMASGHHLAGSELHPCSTATSVRVRDGKQLATDGPFAETKEQLGGYYLIEARDLDEAIGIAARIPSAKDGTIEVRPVAEAGVPATA
ncbi:MAG: YciI family protein [Pyrinomonadaceae bacterium]|nr:YciI family protein [Pyrinomonadaceae bacterium]